MYFGSILAYGDENSEFQMATKICAISSFKFSGSNTGSIYMDFSFHRSLQSYKSTTI